MFRAVKHAVLWGLAHRDLSGIEAIGVDEIQWRSGHTYLTLVYQISGAKRLLWVSHERTEQSLRRHHDLILNWFRAAGTISSGVVEGFNGKAKLTTRKVYGFRTAQGIEFALFHTMGRLPEPEVTHRLC